MLGATITRRNGAMQYAVLLGLALFYGFAFEEFYAEELPNRPGGVRTFPILAFLGAALYLAEPHYAIAFAVGLAVIGSWLALYIRSSLKVVGSRVEGHFIIPASVLIAYVLGPIALTQPLWLSVSFIVATVLLIGSRKPLHDLVTRVPAMEALTAGQFLVLVGIVLPLLYNAPPIPYLSVSPFHLWLAVVAISALSYASYLLQRYVFPGRGIVISAILGGLYSSTATTVVLARRGRDEGFIPAIVGGIVAATGMMYVRILIVCAAFNLVLAQRLAAPMLGLAFVSIATAGVLSRRTTVQQPERAVDSANPLQLGTAFTFAVLLVAVSLVSSWVQTHLGSAGVLALAAIVGFTDIDPFVLSIAQGGAHIALTTGAVAILIASSSNDLLKALYAVLFSRSRGALVPAGILCAISALGLAFAWIMVR